MPATLKQHDIPEQPRPVVVHNYPLGAVAEMEADFRAACLPTPFAIGVSIGLAPVGPCIDTLALATRDKVFCLFLQQPPSPAQSKSLLRIFSNIPYLTGFEFSYTIVLLAHTLGFNVSGYDLSTLAVLPNSEDIDITTPGDFLHSNTPSVSARRINERWDGDMRKSGADSTGTPESPYAFRAWLTAFAADMALSDGLLGQKLSTEFVGRPMLKTYAELASRAIRLELLKPRIYENDFSKVDTHRDGSITIHNSRFKSRIRNSAQAHLEFQLKGGGVVNATIKGTKGRSSFALPGRPLRGNVSRIRVIGREERTNAEKAQYRFLLFSLTAEHHIPLFVNAVWFPANTKHNEGIGPSRKHAPEISVKLNNSQRQIVGAMRSVAPQNSLIIAHGPPGTGKTTTIAAAAELWVSQGSPCWIIAQSNVGVKNIAETLFKNGIDFRLIVSKEFHFEWHEELYVKIEDKVIRSDELPDAPRGVSVVFSNVKVVLCTLSMLSNPKLDNCGLLRLIPVNSLVIDEASQIDVFEFMHLFYKFSDVLAKVCFFGDPKQLPPYGAGEAGLETIFDVKHLKKRAYFLDTQYRLPTRLGEFISDMVYLGKLKSSHDIVDYSCIAFINVSKGEEQKKGSSYQNMEEVQMVVRIARRYRERKLSFCIITFYDPQRAAITKALETADLPTGCVYNVDSFQGNEADYVILSSVRTRRPGFLNSQPRMNVALTRCKKGMVIVTDKCFLQGAGSSTLLGQLCRAWSQHRDGDAWIERRAMLGNHGVELPGLPLRRQPGALGQANTMPASASAFPVPVKTTTKSRRRYPPKPTTKTATTTMTTTTMTANVASGSWSRLLNTRAAAALQAPGDMDDETISDLLALETLTKLGLGQEDQTRGKGRRKH